MNQEQDRAIRARRHELTVVTHFLGFADDAPITGAPIRWLVRAIEAHGWKRVKDGVRRERIGGQSRCVIRFFRGTGRGRRYGTAVFVLGEVA